jgi:probable HAF family extracellular repeat protein
MFSGRCEMKKSASRVTRCLFIVLLGLAINTRSSAQSYTLTDLGTLGGASSEALGINASGQIVGDSYTSSPDSLHAVSWSNLLIKDLDPLFGSNSLGAAYAVNDAGDSVGVIAAQGNYHATLWNQSGHIQNLSPHYFYATACAINASGQIAGWLSRSKDTPIYAAFWPNPTSATILPTLGGPYAQALGINDAGQVVGQSQVPATVYTFHAFLWSEAAGMRDLGTLGGNESSARAINSAGQVVGWSNVGKYSAERAFSWTSSGGMHNLGSLGGYASEARAINDSGTVVGWSYLSDDYTTHAFVWTASGGLQDLNSLIPANSGWVLMYANSINAAGDIVGSGTINGLPHAFLLTPANSYRDGGAGE